MTIFIYPISLHDALPISYSSWAAAPVPQRPRRSWCIGHEPPTNGGRPADIRSRGLRGLPRGGGARSEEHTSELQSPCNVVCRLLLQIKKCGVSFLFMG